MESYTSMYHGMWSVISVEKKRTQPQQLQVWRAVYPGSCGSLKMCFSCSCYVLVLPGRCVWSINFILVIFHCIMWPQIQYRFIQQTNPNGQLQRSHTAYHINLGKSVTFVGFFLLPNIHCCHESTPFCFVHFCKDNKFICPPASDAIGMPGAPTTGSIPLSLPQNGQRVGKRHSLNQSINLLRLRTLSWMGQGQKKWVKSIHSRHSIQ